MASSQGSSVSIEGLKLYYEECGTAPQTVVLVHDGVVNSAVWDDVWPEFCKHFRVIRYDRRGYGRWPAATTWHSETDDLLSLPHHLKISRVVLVGSSHGGELSIEFLDRGKHAFELLDKGDLKAAISEWSKDKYLIAPGNDAARKRLFDLLSANPPDMKHPEYLLRNKQALPRLHEIHVPTLILTGDADIPDVHAHAGVIEAGIPNSRRVVIAGTGHIMYLEKPTEFSRLVINFIERNTDQIK